MDREALHGLIAAHHGNIRGVAAVKDGEPVYEDTFSGFAHEDTLHVMSVTKSVVSLLIGIALDKGLIRDVEQPVLDFFPEYTPKRGEKTLEKVRISHLLTMTAPYKYRSEPWTKVCTSPDWTTAALDLLGGREGLTGQFRYSTLGIHILTGILKKTSGQGTTAFANEHLFGPLGIAPYADFEARTAEEHKQFILSPKPKTNIWFVDPKGVGAAGYGLCISARDLAKIGLLCLNGGVYGGRRIVSEAWIRESTRPRLSCGEHFANMRYGFLWWTPDADCDAYAALGNSGNALYIDPARGMAVSIIATFKPNILDRVQLIREVIEPAL